MPRSHSRTHAGPSPFARQRCRVETLTLNHLAVARSGKIGSTCQGRVGPCGVRVAVSDVERSIDAGDDLSERATIRADERDRSSTAAIPITSADALNQK